MKPEATPRHSGNADVLDGLSRLDFAKLHLWRGRIGGMLVAREPSYATVQFRGKQGETVEETLCRALVALEVRIIGGMPRTSKAGACEACGVKSSELRQLRKQWLCAECRKGLREMDAERRRSARRNQ